MSRGSLLACLVHILDDAELHEVSCRAAWICCEGICPQQNVVQDPALPRAYGLKSAQVHGIGVGGIPARLSSFS